MGSTGLTMIIVAVVQYFHSPPTGPGQKNPYRMLRRTWGEHTTERTEFNQFMQANSRSTNSSSVANQQLYNVNSQPEKQLARDNLSFRASFRHRSFDNDLGFVSRTFRSPLGAVFIFQKQSLEKGWPGPSSLRDGPLFFFDGGEGWKIFACKRFFTCGSY